MKLQVLLFWVLSTPGAVCQDFDETKGGFEFVYHELHHLLLTIHNGSCYFSYIPDSQEVALHNSVSKSALEANVSHWITTLDTDRIWPTSLDRMREKYHDILADYRCLDKGINALQLYPNDTEVFFCDFESATSPMCGFASDGTWARFTGKSPGHHTGPDRDHTCGRDDFCGATGYYVYMDTSRVEAGTKSHLTSQVFTPGEYYHYCLRFYAYMYGDGMGTLNVYVVDPGSSQLSAPVWRESGNQGDFWLEAEVDINRNKSFQFVFEGVRGSNSHSEIAIDDIVVLQGPCFMHPASGQVRLVGGAWAYEGRVELTIDGRWGTICGDHLTTNDATVVCRMLGYDGAHPTVSVGSIYGEGSGHVLMDNVDCKGSEQSIFDCRYSGGRYVGHCDDKSAGVNCQPTRQFSVRLVDGPSQSAGRLEVYMDGRWGTVCDSRFHEEEARVVCRMLGYDSSNAREEDNSFYGKGTSAALLEHVSCQGTETSLLDCSHSAVGDADCHSVVGVVCEEPSGTIVGRSVE